MIETFGMTPGKAYKHRSGLTFECLSVTRNNRDQYRMIWLAPQHYGEPFEYKLWRAHTSTWTEVP